MTPSPDQPPSTRMRQLGRSRQYTAADLPERLRNWHAPRANRWEHLCVEDGTLDIEWLEAEGVRPETLQRDASRWIAPGQRWRIAGILPDASFALEIHADDSVPPDVPQAARAVLLDEAPQASLQDPDELGALLAGLEAPSRCLLRCAFDPVPLLHAVRAAAGGQTLSWHPLESGPSGHAVLLVRTPEPVDLLEYLGRDHAVIEAALARALEGDAERERWLRNTLGRHLVIEEALLFPAYLEAGGRAGWVRGLNNEHRKLEDHLGRITDPTSHRGFLLLLEAHDEKEEQVVYPDLFERLGRGNPQLLARVMELELPAAGT